MITYVPTNSNEAHTLHWRGDAYYSENGQYYRLTEADIASFDVQLWRYQDEYFKQTENGFFIAKVDETGVTVTEDKAEVEYKQAGTYYFSQDVSVTLHWEVKTGLDYETDEEVIANTTQCVFTVKYGEQVLYTLTYVMDEEENELNCVQTYTEIEKLGDVEFENSCWYRIEFYGIYENGFSFHIAAQRYIEDSRFEIPCEQNIQTIGGTVTE